MSNLDITPWLAEVPRIREGDGGYTFESLAVAMVIKLGWTNAAKIAQAVEPHIHNWYVDEAAQQVAPLVDLLGWEQSALLCAWFQNLDNYRMARDTFPGRAGIKLATEVSR